MCSLRQKIDGLDLDPIARKIQRKLRWSDARTERAIEGYRDYLFECGVGGNAKPLLTEDVDEVWHGHILDTQRYAADCDSVFGYFLHHVPSYTGQTCDRAQVAGVTCDRARAVVASDVVVRVNGDIPDLLSPQLS